MSEKKKVTRRRKSAATEEKVDQVLEEATGKTEAEASPVVDDEKDVKRPVLTEGEAKPKTKFPQAGSNNQSRKIEE